MNNKLIDTLRTAALVIYVCLASSFALALPDELRVGMIRFEVERGKNFNALSLMKEADKRKHAVSYASALIGFDMNKAEVISLLEYALNSDDKISAEQRFLIGKAYYHADECISALKTFKKLKKNLSLNLKQELAFYRANCFIKLGSNERARKVLGDILTGLWASHAYYNLGVSYGQSSSSKTKALLALHVAAELNGGESKIEKELSDRIYLAAGSMCLDIEKPQKAGDFFKKIYL